MQKSSSLIQKEQKVDLLNLLDVALIKEAIEIGTKIITGVNGTVKKLVIMMGKSGVGKSTSIAALSGEQLKAFSGINGPILIDKDHVMGEGNSIKKRPNKAYIGGSSASAATSMPVFVQLKSNNGSSEGYYLVDIPGFRDNKSSTQIVINSYYICRIFNIFEKISLFFVIESSYLAAGDRGERLGKSFEEFVDILGGVKAYQKSFSLLITKAQPKLTPDKVREQMKNLMKEAANLSKNEKVLELCKLIAQGSVPILIIIEPQIDDKKVDIPYEKAVLVTEQYEKGIQDAKKIIDQLEPHKFPTVNPATLSREDLIKCLTFVENARKNIDQMSLQCISILQHLLKTQFQLKDLSTPNCEEIFDPIRKATQFFKNVKGLVNSNQLKDITKEKLFEKFNHLEKLFNQTYFKNTKMSQIVTELKDNFIMVDFLSIFDFKQVNEELGTWLNPKHVLITFFNLLILANFDNTIQFQNFKIDEKIQAYSTERIDQFLNKISSSASYKFLKNKSGIIPSYFKKLSKERKKITSFEGFFDSIELLKCNEINFDIQDIERAHTMLTTQNRFLSRQPRSELQVEWKAKMDVRCKQLVNKMLNYESWTEQESDQAEAYLHKITKNKELLDKNATNQKLNGSTNVFHSQGQFRSENEEFNSMAYRIQQLEDQVKDLEEKLAEAKKLKGQFCENCEIM